MKEGKAKEILKKCREFDINSTFELRQFKNIPKDVKFSEIKLVDAYIKEVTPLDEKFYDNRFELYFLIEDIDKLNQGDKKILSSVDFYRLYIKR